MAANAVLSQRELVERIAGALPAGQQHVLALVKRDAGQGVANHDVQLQKRLQNEMSRDLQLTDRTLLKMRKAHDMHLPYWDAELALEDAVKPAAKTVMDQMKLPRIASIRRDTFGRAYRLLKHMRRYPAIEQYFRAERRARCLSKFVEARIAAQKVVDGFRHWFRTFDGLRFEETLYPSDVYLTMQLLSSQDPVLQDAFRDYDTINRRTAAAEHGSWQARRNHRQHSREVHALTRQLRRPQLSDLQQSAWNGIHRVPPVPLPALPNIPQFTL